MSVTQPKLGNQFRVRRPRKANDKAVEKTQSLAERERCQSDVRRLSV